MRLEREKHETFASLKREQKEAVGLLSIGTFLEYFDLMLYVHMAVLLNELFFPKSDPHVEDLLKAFAFCSTYLLRPFGALIFGYIGDTVGRKTTVVLTTFIMAVSCLVMANLPTYAQIGITASWVVTLCRIAQGMSSMGEIVGAELYMTETTKPPTRYALVAAIAVCGTLGSTVALGIASLVTTQGFNWRIAFWIGTGIAILGFLARTKLRETKEFANVEWKVKKGVQGGSKDKAELAYLRSHHGKAKTKTLLAYFLLECAWPVWFYIAYMHCGSILKHSFDFTAGQVIHQNFIVSMVDLLSASILAYLAYFIHPLRILKVKLIIFTVFVAAGPYFLNNVTTPSGILLFQLFITLFAPTGYPAVSVLFIHLPIFTRFRYASFIYALSRALMYVITSFGLIYLIEYLGNWGLLVIMLPATVGYAFGRRHFEQLEIAAGNYPQKIPVSTQ